MGGAVLRHRFAILGVWGDYRCRPRLKPETASARSPHRTRKREVHGEEEKIPGSEGLRLAVSVRSVQALGIAKDMVPAGSRSVSVFLVNRRTPLDADEVRDSRFLFQASLEVQSPEPLVARPDIRGVAAEQGYASSIDPDQRIADLQYRDVCEYAVGHGIATQADVDEQGNCRRVRTCWIPAAEVELIAPLLSRTSNFAWRRWLSSPMRPPPRRRSGLSPRDTGNGSKSRPASFLHFLPGAERLPRPCCTAQDGVEAN